MYQRQTLGSRDPLGPKNHKPHSKDGVVVKVVKTLSVPDSNEVYPSTGMCNFWSPQRSEAQPPLDKFTFMALKNTSNYK